MGRKMKLFVTPDEFRQIKDAELECYEWDRWNDWCWYGKVKSILGGRCPAPYTGPHDVVVIWGCSETPCRDTLSK